MYGTFVGAVPQRHTDETRRFATEAQDGFHLFKRNGVWMATGRGQVGYGEGHTGKRDAINQLYGLTRFVSPLKPDGFHQVDPNPPEKKARRSERKAA